MDHPRFRVGMLGAGAFGLFAIRQFLGLPRVELAALAETRREAARTFAKEHGVPIVADARELVNRGDVDIVYVAVDGAADLINASVASGAKGIVTAGVGNGNLNKAMVDAAAAAVKKGVVVVRSSRVPTGLVGRNVELDDDKLGFIASDELNPQKARVLLSLALLKPPSAAPWHGAAACRASARSPSVR